MTGRPPSRLPHACDLVGHAVQIGIVDRGLAGGERGGPYLDDEPPHLADARRNACARRPGTLPRLLRLPAAHRSNSLNASSALFADSNSKERPTMRISSPSTAPARSSADSTPRRFRRCCRNETASLVLPVGLHHHALHLAALHAEHPASQVGHRELPVAFRTPVFPHMVVLHVGFRLAAGGLAQFVHLGGDGGLQGVDAFPRERADAVELRVDGAAAELVAARRSHRVLPHARGQTLATPRRCRPRRSCWPRRCAAPRQIARVTARARG